MNHQYPGLNPAPPPPYGANGPSQPQPPPYQSVYPQLPPQSTSTQPQVSGYPHYPGMVAIPVAFPPAPPTYQPSPTYVTNHIYHGQPSSSNQPAPIEPEKVVEDIQWVSAFATIASHLTGKAFIGGHQADGSPLWVVRLKHRGSVFPGKFSVLTNIASAATGTKEIKLQDMEVLCAPMENLQWVPANHGNVPKNAVQGGKTMVGLPLYIGRARFQQTLTPGYVYPWKKCCCIGFGGRTVSLQSYEVLCRIK
ncbi:hypothetical protein ABMA28_009607 [Loxostege sticticalis]|uniref:Uncharacterized protein n=1 Tax=Loxostege sticticalis TaxID=481309 RepID=A0ABD0SBV8_LOXSC